MGDGSIYNFVAYDLFNFPPIDYQGQCNHLYLSKHFIFCFGDIVLRCFANATTDATSAFSLDVRCTFLLPGREKIGSRASGYMTRHIQVVFLNSRLRCQLIVDC